MNRTDVCPNFLDVKSSCFYSTTSKFSLEKQVEFPSDHLEKQVEFLFDHFVSIWLSWNSHSKNKLSFHLAVLKFSLEKQVEFLFDHFEILTRKTSWVSIWPSWNSHSKQVEFLFDHSEVFIWLSWNSHSKQVEFSSVHFKLFVRKMNRVSIHPLQNSHSKQVGFSSVHFKILTRKTSWVSIWPSRKNGSRLKSMFVFSSENFDLRIHVSLFISGIFLKTFFELDWTRKEIVTIPQFLLLILGRSIIRHVKGKIRENPSEDDSSRFLIPGFSFRSRVIEWLPLTTSLTFLI